MDAFYSPGSRSATAVGSDFSPDGPALPLWGEVQPDEWAKYDHLRFHLTDLEPSDEIEPEPKRDRIPPKPRRRKRRRRRPVACPTNRPSGWQPGDPTPEDIAAACAEIQAGWTPRERRRRRARKRMPCRPIVRRLTVEGGAA